MILGIPFLDGFSVEGVFGAASLSVESLGFFVVLRWGTKAFSYLTSGRSLPFPLTSNAPPATFLHGECCKKGDPSPYGAGFCYAVVFAGEMAFCEQ